jgi:integrase/recombinase XerD
MTPNLPLPAGDIATVSGQVLTPYVPRPKTPKEAAEEFFAARISNENTRKAYVRDTAKFFDWCLGHGLALEAVTPVHVAAYREHLLKAGKLAKDGGSEGMGVTSVKRHMSALRMLFSHMVQTGAMGYNPAREVKTPTVKRAQGKTPALSPTQMRALFESLDPKKPIDLRDRALIATMAYTFARVSAACRLVAADYVRLGYEARLRLQEKGDVHNDVPCHPQLASYLEAWLAHSGAEGKVPLFPSFDGRSGRLNGKALSRHDALQIVKRRLRAAGLSHLFSNHSFRATGITTFLENGGGLETAQAIAGHADSRTTKGYDRRGSKLAMEEIARVRY